MVLVQMRGGADAHGSIAPAGLPVKLSSETVNVVSRVRRVRNAMAHNGMYRAPQIGIGSAPFDGL